MRADKGMLVEPLSVSGTVLGRLDTSVTTCQPRSIDRIVKYSPRASHAQANGAIDLCCNLQLARVERLGDELSEGLDTRDVLECSKHTSPAGHFCHQ
jgi:hypothetical protein